MNRKGSIYIATILAVLIISTGVSKSQVALFDSLKNSIDTLKGVERIIKLQEAAKLFKSTSLIKGEYFLEESEELIVESGLDSLLAINYNILGNLYMESGLIDQAENQYLNSLEINKNLEDPDRIATETHNLGIIYLERDDTLKAIDYFKQSLDARFETNNNRRIGDGLTTLGVIYQRYSEFDKSIDCLTRALEYYSELDIYQRKFECYAFLADNYLMINPEKALDWIEEMEDMYKADSNNILKSIYKIYFRKGQYYLKAGDYHSASNWFDMIDNDSTDLTTEYKPLETLRELSEKLFESGENKHALDAAATARKYKRRYEDEQIRITINEYKARLDMRSMEEEIQRAEELNTIVLKRIQTERLFKYALFLVLLILTVTVSSLLLNFIKLKNDQASLSKRNRELNEANIKSIAYKDNILSFRENKSFFFNILTDKLLIPFTDLTARLNNLSDSAKKSFNKKTFLKDLQEIFLLSTSIEKSLKRILVWSKLQRKKYDLQKEVVNVSDYLHELLPEVLKLAIRYNIKVSYDLDPGLNINFDRKAFRSIIKIFVENSIENSKKNSEIIIRAKKANNGGIISVTDFGKGINPDLQDSLFDLKKRHKHTESSDPKKLGLGLLMSKHLAEINNSYISFESALNKGTTFYLHIKKDDDR